MNIAIVMTTYFPDGPVGDARFEYAQEVISSLHNLTPKPLLIIADDTGKYRDLELLRKRYSHESVLVLGPNQGVGASINRALRYLHNRFGDEYAWMYLPDDLVLVKRMNLLQAIGLLDYYDFVRLDLPHPNINCTIKFEVNRGWWLELDYSKGGFVFATRPTLIGFHIHRILGPFKEFANSYDVEIDYSKRVEKALLKGALSCDLGNAWEHLATDDNEVGLNDKFNS